MRWNDEKLIDFATAHALLQEALTKILNGDETGMRVLHDIAIHTIGLERLAAKTRIPKKSLQRMLSAKGSPTHKNLMLILSAIRKVLNVQIEADVIPAWIAMERLGMNGLSNCERPLQQFIPRY